MDPDEAPPRLRRRLLALVVGSLVLLPVLYVAASGPLEWWSLYRYRRSDSIMAYFKTLDPLINLPETEPIFSAYSRWWGNLPVPRSRQRQYLIDQLADHRGRLEEMRVEVAEDQKQLAALKLQLGALESHTDLTPELSREAVVLRSEIAKLEIRLNHGLLPLLGSHEGHVQRLVDALREFDRRK